MELPFVMATLTSLKLEEGKTLEEISDSAESEAEKETINTRKMRPRKTPLKRLQKHQLRTQSPKTKSEKEIKDFYVNVNKKCRIKHTNLETIFEEPKESSDGNVVTMSGAKVRRSILFTGISKTKKVKRKAKMQKFQLERGRKKRMTLEDVKLRLAESLEQSPLESDD